MGNKPIMASILLKQTRMTSASWHALLGSRPMLVVVMAGGIDGPGL
ncbi:MAG: hypothetical protein V1897_07450 [Pseudomonadota bacterium]